MTLPLSFVLLILTSMYDTHKCTILFVWSKQFLRTQIFFLPSSWKWKMVAFQRQLLLERNPFLTSIFMGRKRKH